MAGWSISTVYLRRAGALALLLALSTLAAIAFFSQRDWSDMAQSRDRSLKSSRLLNLDQRVLGWVRDAETSQRGYLITGNAQYLAAYRQALKLLPDDLRDLQATAADQPMAGDVRQLAALILEKMTELQHTIEIRDSQGPQAALAIVATGRGEMLMDHIRSLALTIGAQAEARWAVSRTNSIRHNEQARLVTIVGVALLAVLVLGAFAANESSARQREALIDELAEANNRSSEVEELLRTTLYSIDDAVITTNVSGAVQLINSKAEKLTGWIEREAQGRAVEEVVKLQAEGTGAELTLPVRAALNGGGVRSGNRQGRLIANGGAEFLVEANAAPIRDSSGTLRGAVLVIHDASEIRRGDERLRQAAKLESLGVLAGGIAHDFNNLLVGIVGASSLLEEYFPANAPGSELIQTLQNAGQRAAQLTNQMLAYSGRGRFVVRPLDLSREVEEIAALLSASISKNVDLRLSLAEGLPKVEADEAQLQQLIMNLVVNASEAVGDGRGFVRLATSTCVVTADQGPANVIGEPVPPGIYVLLSVSDTGKGMDQATRARIFDPFFTTKFTGRGLGLAATLGIVKGHGGAIEVESAPGQGATFRVYLPAKGTAAPAVSA